jgi:hypothetical protein
MTPETEPYLWSTEFFNRIGRDREFPKVAETAHGSRGRSIEGQLTGAAVE